jgi:hypothetical protein
MGVEVNGTRSTRRPITTMDTYSKGMPTLLRGRPTGWGPYH